MEKVANIIAVFSQTEKLEKLHYIAFKPHTLTASDRV